MPPPLGRSAGAKQSRWRVLCSAGAGTALLFAAFLAGSLVLSQVVHSGAADLLADDLADVIEERELTRSGGGFWLGLGAKSLEAINKGTLSRGRSAAPGKKQQAAERSSGSRPKWLADLEQRDRTALIRKIGADKARALGLSARISRSDVSSNAGVIRARSHLQRKIRAREQSAGELIEKWKSIGNIWPPEQEAHSKPVTKIPPGGLRLSSDLGVIVMYVHNRPQYLRVALEGLSEVQGIEDILLIVSHDGFYPEMDALVKNITFCPVKQLYYPYSVHNGRRTFPAPSPADCTGRDRAGCFGQKDSYGAFRNANVTSLKHHWWWLMNTVWHGVGELADYTGHVLFVEEDHFLFPNAVAQLRALIQVKHEQDRFSSCIAVNAAPADVASRGETGVQAFVEEKMGNVGYAFNRSIWNIMHAQRKEFCFFDDYNWDVSLSDAVLRFWPYSSTLRWSRTSALHFGACTGLHLHGAKRAANAPFTNADGPDLKTARACIEPTAERLRSQLLNSDAEVAVDEDAVHWRLEGSPHGERFFGWGGVGGCKGPNVVLTLCPNVWPMTSLK